MPIKYNSTLMYLLVDPRDESVHYVGQTTDPHRRLGQHISSVKSGICISRRDKWVTGLLKQKVEPAMWILREVRLDRAKQVEQRLISWLFTLGCPLTNQECALMEAARRLKDNPLENDD